MVKSLYLPVDPSARAKVPGTVVVSYEQNMVKGVEVEIHRVKTEGQVFLVDLLRALKAAPHGYFVVGRVTDEAGEKVFWSFDREGIPKEHYYGKLCYDEASGEYFIIIINRRNFRQPALERIIPISDLPVLRPATMGDEVVYVGGRIPIGDLIAAKYRLAKAQGHPAMDVRLNPIEKMHANLQDEREAERLDAENFARLARKEADNQARQREILSRPEIEVWGKDGKKRWGIPVTEGEWKTLPTNSPAIMVKAYPADALEVVSAFFVEKKRGGKCSRKAEVFDLTLERPVRQIVEAQPRLQLKSGFLIDMDGKESVVFVVNKETYDLMRNQGVNNGTLVALDREPDAQGRHQVFELDKNFEGGTRPLSMFKPLCSCQL